VPIGIARLPSGSLSLRAIKTPIRFLRSPCRAWTASGRAVERRDERAPVRSTIEHQISFP
jgi:hypothetical protein